MNAPPNEAQSVEFWKSQCSILEQQILALRDLNSSLCRQNEEKFLENTRLIRMIQTFNKNQTKSGETSDDTVDFFYTFPEEVWPFILVYVKNSLDLVSLCDASPLLGSLMLNKDKPVWIFDQLLPNIFKWLSLEDVLTCRLVCKKWNHAIESYRDSYSDSPVQQLELPSFQNRVSQLAPKYWKTKLEPYDFDSTAQLTRFGLETRAHLQTSGRNLLFTRALKLGLEPDNIDHDNINNDLQAFWETALSLLRLIGKDIWHIEIYNDGFEDDEAAFYSVFQQLLCLLPQLKTLRLICEFENRFMLNELNYRLGAWPLPCLPHLETFHLLHSVPFQITASMLTSYATQLKKFVVSVSSLLHVEVEHLRGLLNLSELVLRDCVKDEAEFQLVIRKLEKLECPNLLKLRLFRSYTDNEFITISYMFNLLQKFPRLQALDTYRMIVVVKPEDRKKWLPNIYSLRSLKIKNNRRLSFSFLEKLPCLEKLVIRKERILTARQEDEEEDTGLEDKLLRMTFKSCNSFREFEFEKLLQQKKLYESRIWKMLPKLTRIVCESDDDGDACYTRETLEYNLKQEVD